MKNIEKSTPLTVVMKFYAPTGGDYSLAGLQYALWYRSSSGLKQILGYMAAPDGSAISYTFPAGELTKTGYYSLVIELKNSTTGKVMNKVVFENAFAVYPEGYVRNDGTLATTSQDGTTVITVGAIAEFGVFSKEIPISVGEDGYWYANLDGEGMSPLRDSDGDPIPSTHSLTYDSETKSLWIDRGVTDPDGNNVEEEITAVADALAALTASWNAAYASWNLTFQAAEGTRDGSVAGDGSRWGDLKTTIANFKVEQDGLIAYYRQEYNSMKNECTAAASSANTAAARAETVVGRAEEVISKAIYAEEIKTVETPTDMVTATAACVAATAAAREVAASRTIVMEVVYEDGTTETFNMLAKNEA